MRKAYFFVSMQGSDASSGTRANPFATIAAAQAAARRCAGPAVVEVLAGTYREQLVFDARDSGDTYFTREGACLSGGISVPYARTAPVSGTAAVRFPEDAAAHIRCISLDALGVAREEFEIAYPVGRYSTGERYGAPSGWNIEVFEDGSRMIPARWPNEGFAHLAGVADQGQPAEFPPQCYHAGWSELKSPRAGAYLADEETRRRAGRWRHPDDVWLYGYFYWDWADSSTPASLDPETGVLTPRFVSRFGAREGAAYFFYNIPDELDAPGEYWLDRGTGELYVYPHRGDSTFSISVARAPLVRLCSAAGAARSGIFYKDSTAISSLAEAGAVAFSKPGTLTDGNPKVVSVKAERMGPEVLIKIAAHAMAYSNTPQARSIIAAYGGTIYIDLVQDFVEIPGSGVEVTVDGIKICVGTRDLMTVKHVSVPDSDLTEEYAVYVAIGDEYAGRITLNDNVRPDAASGVADLARCGVGKVVMFTDESRDSAAQAAASLGIVEYYSEHGIGRTREAIGEVRRGCASGEKLVFVGDPNCFNGTHTDADADVAMAGLDALSMPLGTDVTIVGGKVERLPLAIAIAKYSEKLILCCAAGALLAKLALLALGFFGIATMWFAVFIDACAAVGVSLASILAFSGESYS